MSTVSDDRWRGALDRYDETYGELRRYEDSRALCAVVLADGMLRGEDERWMAVALDGYRREAKKFKAAQRAFWEAERIYSALKAQRDGARMAGSPA